MSCNYDIAQRPARRTSIGPPPAEQVNAILDMICKTSTECSVSFRWRPHLKDPADDFILELAVQSQSEYIITYNKSDLAGVEEFAIDLLTPKEFLQLPGEIES